MLGGLRVFFFPTSDRPLSQTCRQYQNIPRRGTQPGAGSAGGHTHRQVTQPAERFPPWPERSSRHGKRKYISCLITGVPRVTSARARKEPPAQTPPPLHKRWRNTRRRSSFLHPSPSSVFQGRHELLQSKGVEAVTVFTHTHTQELLSQVFKRVQSHLHGNNPLCRRGAVGILCVL